jgi:hypothetical protein
MTKIKKVHRLIVLGKNSKVWLSLKNSPVLVDTQIVEIGHQDLEDFQFHHGDKVWVFSYSRSVKENRLMMEILAHQPHVFVIYVSSASTNVTSVTSCYNYPTVKRQAHSDVMQICSACVVNIGWFYVNLSELPAGLTAATAADELAIAVREGDFVPGQTINLFELIHLPFKSSFEAYLYRLYGLLLKVCSCYPCFLRPIDLVLRLVGIRWYGYLYLSNKLWSTTI